MRGRTDSSSSSSAVTQPLKALDAASIMASVTCLAPTPMHPNATPASSPTQTQGARQSHWASTANASPQAPALWSVSVHIKLILALWQNAHLMYILFTGYKSVGVLRCMHLGR